jgi:hypothetical protein
VKLLGNFGTTHSVEALFEMASRDDPLARGLRKSVWYAIESIPAHDSRQQNRYREELSPILESGLEGTRTDPAFYRAVTQAIALIGTASGTELLLKEWQTARSKEEQEVVEFALMSTSNPNAVPVLESVLQEDANLVSGVGQVAGSALASMGDKDATRALLEWAAGTEGATMRAEALAWLAQAAVERESLEMIREAGKRYEFRDPVTKEEIVKMAQTIEQEGNKVEML